MLLLGCGLSGEFWKAARCLVGTTFRHPSDAILFWWDGKEQRVKLTWQKAVGKRDVFTVASDRLVLKLGVIREHNHSNEKEAALAKASLDSSSPKVYGCLCSNWDGALVFRAFTSLATVCYNRCSPASQTIKNIVGIAHCAVSSLWVLVM